MKFWKLILVIITLALAIPTITAFAAEAPLTQKEELGKIIFFDENLSLNQNQSCATCHGPEVGYVGPDSMINAHGSVYEGSVPGAFGNRKPPSSAYGGESPILSFDKTGGVWIGGMFWDGRATGWSLGDPLAEQAKGPFLNPMEQALPDAASLVSKIKASTYAGLFEPVWGKGSLDIVNDAYDIIGRSVAAYERSGEVNPFTSKYDYYLKGEAKLTGLENEGLKLFEGKAMCSACHISEPGAGGSPLFTDFTYDNLGIPKNLENPATIADPTWVDPGLGGFLKASGDYSEEVYMAEWGKFKVPTLRNVALKPNNKTVKAYGHNGYFKSLEEIVHFYNTRDVEGAGWKGDPWPVTEYGATMNTDKLGDLELTKLEEEALVEFLKTLSDGYVNLPILNDIAGHWAEANIKELINKGAISGYPDSSFKPDQTITRAEFAVALVNGFNLQATGDQVFKDTATHWAKDYIATANGLGILTGYGNGLFGPDDLITREQMAVMIVKAAQLASPTNGKIFSDGTKISAWAKLGVDIASGNQIILGYPDNTYRPLGNATRAEAVTVIINALKLK